MTCRHFVARLGEFVAREFFSLRDPELLQHIVSCPACPSYATTYCSAIRLARAALRDREVPETLPTALSDRIMAQRRC